VFLDLYGYGGLERAINITSAVFLSWPLQGTSNVAFPYSLYFVFYEQYTYIQVDTMPSVSS
jgi:hypothetical protein